MFKFSRTFLAMSYSSLSNCSIYIFLRLRSMSRNKLSIDNRLFTVCFWLSVFMNRYIWFEPSACFNATFDDAFLSIMSTCRFKAGFLFIIACCGNLRSILSYNSITIIAFSSIGACNILSSNTFTFAYSAGTYLFALICSISSCVNV